MHPGKPAFTERFSALKAQCSRLRLDTNLAARLASAAFMKGSYALYTACRYSQVVVLLVQQ